MPYWFDGNNLIGQPVARAREDRSTRRAFLEELSGFSRWRGGRFLVFFDGDDPDKTSAPPGVQVRYSAPLSTDDAILSRLEETRMPSEVLVVTNDRSLGHRCRNAGAKALDWSGFLSKMRRSEGARTLSPGAEDEKVNVDDWMRYFGFDKRKLK